MRYFLFIFFLLISLKAFSQDTIYHKIIEKETLYKISKIYDVSIESLQKNNNLKENIVIPGQTILVYRNPILSLSEIQRNTKIYDKELIEKKILDFETYLEKRLTEIEVSKSKLNEAYAADFQRILALSREKKELKDSIRTQIYNSKSEIRKLDSQIELLEISIEENKNIIKKDKKSKPEKDKKNKTKELEEEKNEVVEKLENEKTSALKDKEEEEEKTLLPKNKLLEKNRKDSIQAYSKNLKENTDKLTLKNSNNKAKDNKKKKTEKIVSSKVVVDDKLINEANNLNKKQKSKNKKELKDSSNLDENTSLKFDTEKNKKSIDSLKLVKEKNNLFLKNKLKQIEEDKAKLDVEKDLQRVLVLSKEKFVVTDSVNNENKAIDILIKQKISEAKNTEIADVSLPKPKKIKKVKEDELETLEFGFDNSSQIDTNKLSKEELNDFKNSLEEDISIDSSKTSITRNVETANINKSKKKKKYEFGDEVEMQLQEKAKFFLARAKGEIDQQNITKAKDFIDKSLALNPSYADAYTLKGDIFSSLSYFDKALNQYKKASILNPKNAQLHYNMGNCYIRMDKDDLAIKQWTKAIEIDDEYILAYSGRASLFMKNKKFNQALEDYNKIFTINKYFYVAYKGRGVAHLELGNFGKAIIDFNNFLEFEADDAYIYWKRGLAKLYDNEIYGGCMDLLSSSEFGNNEAQRALKKHCEK